MRPIRPLCHQTQWPKATQGPPLRHFHARSSRVEGALSERKSSRPPASRTILPAGKGSHFGRILWGNHIVLRLVPASGSLRRLRSIRNAAARAKRRAQRHLARIAILPPPSHRTAPPKPILRATDSSRCAALCSLAIPARGRQTRSCSEGGTVKAQHGDWQVVCKPPPPGAKNEVCALVQSVTAEDRNNVGLTVYFQKFSDGSACCGCSRRSACCCRRASASRSTTRTWATRRSCAATTSPATRRWWWRIRSIEQLKTGKTAVFIIFQTEEAGIGIPISLAGFGQALNGLR